MRPWLSAIMPTYNGERFLADALASVAAQCDDDIEVVAIDDGSTDATLEILSRWSGRLRLAIIERRHSGDWVSSTAVGMAAARGRYLCWLHQDDMWRKGRLAALRGLVQAQPDAAFIVHPCWYSDTRGERIGYWRCRLRRAGRLLHYGEVAAPLLVQCSIATCGTLFTADAARAVGPPDAALLYHADWDYWLRLAQLGCTLYHPTPLASFRIHATSQTIARAGEADRRLAEARAIIQRHLAFFAATVGDAARIRTVALVSAELNHALNSLVAGQVFDAAGLLHNVLALGPQGWATLVRDSQILERCLSRLHASAELQPTVIRGLRRSMVRCFARRATFSQPLSGSRRELNSGVDPRIAVVDCAAVQTEAGHPRFGPLREEMGELSSVGRSPSHL